MNIYKIDAGRDPGDDLLYVFNPIYVRADHEPTQREIRQLFDRIGESFDDWESRLYVSEIDIINL